MPWTAKPHHRTDKSERSSVALVQPGDGRDPDKDPFAQGPVMHLMSPATARALAAELIRAADDVDYPGPDIDPKDCVSGEFYIAIHAYGAETIPFVLSTAHYDNARAMGMRCRPCIWGFSVYRRIPGYRTMGLDFADWLTMRLHRNMIIRRDYDRVAAHKKKPGHAPKVTT